jgi:alpha-D-ribose 1-methylphosphonate 5-triphosphate synthase subunit PhnH
MKRQLPSHLRRPTVKTRNPRPRGVDVVRAGRERLAQVRAADSTKRDVK